MKQILYTLFLLITVTSLATAQISEDFESGFPAEWSKADVWMHGDAGSLSSQYFNIPAHTMFMAVNDDAAGPNGSSVGRMVTPAIDLTGIEYPFLQFDYYFLDGDYGGDDEQARIYVSVDTGSTWTEVANLASGNWETHSVSLKDYLDQTVWVGFDYNDGGGWNYGFCVDNVTVINYTVFSDVVFTQVAADCSHAIEGAEFEMRIGIRNLANTDLTHMDVVVSPEGGTEATFTLTDLNIPPFGRGFFGVPATMVMDTDDQMYNIELTNLNTGEDEDKSNNALDFMVEYVEPADGSAAVVEEATGTWCTWCPRGATYLDRAFTCFEDHFVGIAVHNQDPMVHAAYDDALTSGVGFPGFPSVVLDRGNYLDPADIFVPIKNKILLPPQVDIDATVTLDTETRELNVSATGTFNTDIPAGYRWNAIIVEDSVTGTAAAYNQINAYAGGRFGIMGGYENLPSSVPASMMVYDHVARELLGGYTGVAGSIPDLGPGETSSFDFDTWTVPTQYDLNKIKVAILVHNGSGRIINGGEFEPSEPTATFEVDNQEVNWMVAPNPMTNYGSVIITLPEPGEVQLTMIDMMGRVVSQERHEQAQGTMTYEFRRNGLPSGMYSMILEYKGKRSIEKVVIN